MPRTSAADLHANTRVHQSPDNDNPHQHEDSSATTVFPLPAAPTTAAELSAALPLKLVKKLLYAHDDIRYKISAQVQRERAGLAEEEQRQCVLLEERDERASLSAEGVNAAMEVLRLDIRCYEPVGRRLIETEEQDERSRLLRRRNKSLLYQPVGRHLIDREEQEERSRLSRRRDQSLLRLASIKQPPVSSSDDRKYPPDWQCTSCFNINFARRTECNRCSILRTADSPLA